MLRATYEPIAMEETDMSRNSRITKKILIDKARGLGLKNVQKLRKTELIHGIQVAEGNSPCFQRIPDCAVSPCMFRSECIPQN